MRMRQERFNYRHSSWYRKRLLRQMAHSVRRAVSRSRVSFVPGAALRLLFPSHRLVGFVRTAEQKKGQGSFALSVEGNFIDYIIIYTVTVYNNIMEDL